jgi:hypothetical protein
VETTSPIRAATFVADVVVPAAQAGISGALISGAVTFVVSRTDWYGSLLTLWLGVTVIVSCLAWVVLLMDSRRLLWAVERLTGKDLDGDGRAGQPEKQTIEVVVIQGGHQRIIGAGWLGLSDDQILMLAADLTRGRSLAEGDLGKDSMLFPKGINQFRTVRGKLVEAGLIAMVNPQAPNLGYEITRAGRAVFQRLAQNSTHTHTHANGHGKSA